MPGCEGVAAYAIDGPPALCVWPPASARSAIRPTSWCRGSTRAATPDARSCTRGRSAPRSTAQSFGCSALAVSVDVSDPWRYDTAARVALDVMPMLLEAPARSVLNLNVPARAYEDILGVRWARLAAFGSVRAAIAESSDARIQFELRATGVQAPPDSDQGLVDQGYASLTTIVGVAEAWPAEGQGRGRPRCIRRSSPAPRSSPCTRCPTRPRHVRCTARCTRERSRPSREARRVDGCARRRARRVRRGFERKGHDGDAADHRRRARSTPKTADLAAKSLVRRGDVGAGWAQRTRCSRKRAASAPTTARSARTGHCRSSDRALSNSGRRCSARARRRCRCRRPSLVFPERCRRRHLSRDPKQLAMA